MFFFVKNKWRRLRGARARTYTHTHTHTQNSTLHNIPMCYIIIIIDRETPSRSHCRLYVYSPLAGARDVLAAVANSTPNRVFPSLRTVRTAQIQRE